MTFKDLHYSLGKFKTDVRSQLARKNPLQNQDTKALSMWIFEERNDLKAMRVSAYHRNETTKAFLDWIDEHDDPDLQDIGGKLAQLIEMHTEVEHEYVARYQKYRRIIKTIRERDETILSSAREKKRAVEGRLNHLYKSNRKSRKIPQFEQELAQLSTELEEKEIEMADYKRLALREAFYVRFNALHEYAEKLSLMAGFGNYLVDLLDIEPTTTTTTTEGEEEGHQKRKRKAYDKYQETDMIWMDCKLAVEGWQPNQDDQDVERPTVLEDLLLKEDHDGDSGSLLLDDDAEMLTENDVMTPPPPSSSSEQQQQEEKEFNEKWTYVATFDKEKQNMNVQQELMDPPPAYTPPTGNIVASEKENNMASGSSNSNSNSGNKNKHEPIDLSHPQPQPSITATSTTTNTTTPPIVCTTTTPAATLTTTCTVTTTGARASTIMKQQPCSSSCHSDSNNGDEEHHLATTTYHATDYKELYEQITQQEKTSKPPRPYIEFQQKLLHR